MAFRHTDSCDYYNPLVESGLGPTYPDVIACRYRIALLEMAPRCADLQISLACRFPLGTIMTSLLFIVQFQGPDAFGDHSFTRGGYHYDVKLLSICAIPMFNVKSNARSENHTWSNDRQ